LSGWARSFENPCAVVDILLTTRTVSCSTEPTATESTPDCRWLRVSPPHSARRRPVCKRFGVMGDEPGRV
jgi:hypothetical protein